MIEQKLIVDYSLFEEKMGRLGTKVIPYARVQAQKIAEYGQKAVKLFTLRGGTRTPGRSKIAELWELHESRSAQMDIYTIRNLYPNQDVIVIFEEGAMVHQILPKKKRVLYWEDAKTGQEIFARSVHHPGVPASHMLERTRQVIEPRIDLWMRATFAMTDAEMRG